MSQKLPENEVRQIVREELQSAKRSIYQRAVSVVRRTGSIQAGWEVLQENPILLQYTNFDQWESDMQSMLRRDRR